MGNDTRLRIEELVERGLPSQVVEILRNEGIENLNPIQREAIKKGLLDGRNIVVAAPTASGKTLIGELALLHNALKGRMGIYLVPLRALASEKYEEFKKWEKIGLRIGISTGDYESPGEHLGRYDILVATYERFDSLLRLRPRWLPRIGVVVIDELHMVGDPERGPILEMIIARLLDTNIQVVGLSATIGNPKELAEWLGAERISMEWRPVRLIEGAYDRRNHRIVFYEDHQPTRIERIVHRLENPALSIALQSVSKGIQVLVFVNNRRRAEEWAYRLTEHMNLLRHLIDKKKIEELLEELKESPSTNERERLSQLLVNGVAYHHAGLSSVARRVVEKGFRDRVIRAVFATPTLAAGVNLPARRVLVSIKRYDPVTRRMRGIPVFEYKQMAGRAGRPQYDPYGEAVIYDASSLREAQQYIHGRLEPVESKLSNERSLRIHTLALIATRQASTIDEILEVFSRTLFKLQYGNVGSLKYKLIEIIEQLIAWKMLEEQDKELRPTRLGYLTTITYLDPLSTHMFGEVVKEKAKPGNLWLLHSIALTPDYRRSRPYIPYRIIDSYEEDALFYADQGIIPEPPTYDEYEYMVWLQAFVQALMLNDWINEKREDEITQKYGVGPGDIYSARDTAAWISGSLSKIMREQGRIELAQRLDKLSLRLEYGVKEDALQLVMLEGIGRVRARTLISNGIRTLEDLASTPPEKLLRLPGFGPRIVESIKKQLERMGIIGRLHGES